jgi:biotin synthase
MSFSSPLILYFWFAMKRTAHRILEKETLNREDLVYLLTTRDKSERMQIFRKAAAVRERYVKNNIYLKGLIEFSNRCANNCYYCGIRGDNESVNRYTLPAEEVIETARHAFHSGYGTVLIQSGERRDTVFTNQVCDLLRQIKMLSNNKLGITLNCGVQSDKVYREWFDWGAHSYILGMATFSEELYGKLHPLKGTDTLASKMDRLAALKRIGYHTGAALLVGLPFQTADELAGEIIRCRDIDLDLVCLDSYIPHDQTPLAVYRDELAPSRERFELAQRMIALARIVLKDVNIIPGLSLDAIHPSGRAIGIISGANILLPNLTPCRSSEQFELFNDKELLNDYADCTVVEIIEKVRPYELEIIYEDWGDSPHFRNRIMKN